MKNNLTLLQAMKQQCSQTEMRWSVRYWKSFSPPATPFCTNKQTFPSNLLFKVNPLWKKTVKKYIIEFKLNFNNFFLNIITTSNHFETAILNYKMVSVGFLYNNGDTLVFGDNVICKLDQFLVNQWPSKVLRLAWNSLAYSSDTSTLLVCGGNYVSNFFFKIKLFASSILAYKIVTLKKCQIILNDHQLYLAFCNFLGYLKCGQSNI